MTRRGSDAWESPLLLPAAKGTPEERAAAVQCLTRVAGSVADGSAGLRVVLQALGLDDEPETDHA